MLGKLKYHFGWTLGKLHDDMAIQTRLTSAVSPSWLANFVWRIVLACEPGSVAMNHMGHVGCITWEKVSRKVFEKTNLVGV